ncbi:MAG: enoyl-CoA hydratase/isomerase family protein [Paraburkholderia sp.]|uniref:enoyl-CoA hydratase/isomerase family protein n=1 Tax=Paraburkholderia sp. TaxID=1926495 RepID=UPI003C622FD1
MSSPTNTANTTNIADPKVLLRVVNRVAIITLNRPAALNSLSNEMIHELARLVEQCRVNDNIVALVLRGAGEKGFCAGGDVRELYHSVTSGNGNWKQFFVDEYRLDYALHIFPKPVVALMDGIVMGGGMGLAQGADIRVVTERTKMAMPETRIGFIPDVGATRFLNAMSLEYALYVGLTGITLSGPDAVRLRLADLCVPSSWLATFEERLSHMSTNGDLLESLRNVFEPPLNVMPRALLATASQLILRHFERFSNIERTVATLQRDLGGDPPREVRQWLQTTLDAMRSHSPTMLYVTREALIRGRQMTLAECFRMELSIGHRAIEDGDFRDGVRALLVNKDNRPRWTPATLHEVRPERVKHFLSSPWRIDTHPLADLGVDFVAN